MKIVIVTVALPPYLSGVATSTVNLASELSKKHTVIVVAGSIKKKSSQKIINPHLKYLFLPGMLVVKKNITIPYPNLKKIETLLTTFKPDIVHLQDIGPASFSTLAFAKKMNLPIVMSHHFTAEMIFKALIPSHQLSNRLSRSANSRQLVYDLVRSVYNYSQLVTVPTAALIPYFKKAKLKPPIMAISNGIITANFKRHRSKPEVLKQFGISQKRLILSVGRLDADKSLHLLIEAFNAIHPLNPDTSLVFVGQGTQFHQLQRQTRQLNLTKAVYFLGSIPNNSRLLSDLYNAADIFASPSIIESQGMVFLEAMAAGAPIVAVNSPVLAGMIKPFKNGLLVPPNEVKFLSAAIQKLLSDSLLRRQMSRRNRLWAKKFDTKHTTRLYLQAYQKALRLKRRALKS